MGNSASQAAGLEKAEVPLDECIAGLTDVVSISSTLVAMKLQSAMADLFESDQHGHKGNRFWAIH